MSEVTISQALRYASKLKSQISEARSRAASSLSHKKDEETAFSFSEMLERADNLSYDLAKLQGKLAVANATAIVKYNEQDITLSHAIRILQELKGRIAWVKALPSLATEIVVTYESDYDELQSKYVRQKIETCCSLPEAKKAALADHLQEEFDALNGAVETINQTVTLTI
jgi:hypothetical protein